MATNKQPKRKAAARSTLAGGSALPLPAAEEIEHAQKFVIANKAKLRAGGKMTINTTTMKTRVWPTIEIWDAAKRRYLPLSIGNVWRYDTSEARDAVLSRLNTPLTGAQRPV